MRIPALLLLLCFAAVPPLFAGQEIIIPAEQATESTEETQIPQTTAEQPQPVREKPAVPVISREGLQRDVAQTPNTPGSGRALTEIVISLAIVILVIIILAWGFKKLTLRLPGSRQIKVICSLPLGTKERLLVIEIQGKQRVLGVTPHNVNFLFELENPLPEEKLASDFHTQLQSFLKK